MKNNKQTNRHNSLQRRSEQGIALVTTLLLLTLLSAVTVGMVVAASSDELISGYNRNMRSSFYASDSGLNVARQSMVNQLVAAVPASITNRSAQPLSAGLVDTFSGGTVTAHGSVTYALLSSYGSSNVSINSGQAANSWPGKYKISSATLALGGCSVTGGAGGAPTCAAPCTSACTTAQANAITGYTYTYNYTLTAVGQSHASEMTTVDDKGSLILNVTFGPPSGTVTSFAAYGMFINTYNICDGSTLVPGTITGPVFSNGSWNFGTSGSYIFTDPVGAVNANLGYQFSGTCKQSASSSSTSSGVTIAPTFQAGYQLGQTPVPLPANDYNQKQAVLDGKGAPPPCAGVSTPCPALIDLHNGLRNVSTTQYPSGGAASGVYLPYTLDTTSAGCPAAASCKVMTGGGIYVDGNAAVTLSTSGTAPYLAQITTIVQGGTTTTITTYPSGISALNPAAQTTVASGASSTTITGVPAQYDPASGSLVRDATMLYVNGNVTSLAGPGSNNPAIQDGSAMTVTAASNITITDDILYKTKPVTTTQNQIPGTPPSTLIPGNDKGQVLGLFTNTGDIQLANCSGCGNLEIDASLATISQSGSGGLVNTGSAINTLTILGGRIQNNIKNINSTTRNVIFDRRFANNGFAPPWFPSTTITPTGVSGATVTPQIQRVQWINQTPF